MLLESIEKSDTFHALFMLRENKELINPSDRTQLLYIRIICSRVMKDLVEENRQNTSSMSPLDTQETQIGYILDFMLGIEQAD